MLAVLTLFSAVGSYIPNRGIKNHRCELCFVLLQQWLMPFLPSIKYVLFRHLGLPNLSLKKRVAGVNAYFFSIKNFRLVNTVISMLGLLFTLGLNVTFNLSVLVN